MEERREPTGGADQRPRTPRKKKRRRGRAGGTLLYVAFIIGVSALLATVGWIAANDVLALNKADHSAIITITDGETFGQVVDDLKENGIIEFKLVFNLYASFSHAADKVAPGTYELNTDMDYRAIVTNLGTKSASRLTVKVTIPEGFTVEQIFQRLEEEGVSTVAKLSDMAANHDYAFSFLQDIPLGKANRLEGFLFPDTYEFYLGEDPKTVLNKMLVNFDRKFTDQMRQKAADNGYSVFDIVTIASMIEKETDGTDQTTISSVIYNRLTNPGAETVGLLQVDATLVYALGRTITQADYTADTPYNTYTNQGLPPGPISNPGMSAINAAMNPESTGYYYYVLGNDGVHHFFKTHQGQLDFIAQQQAAKANG